MKQIKWTEFKQLIKQSSAQDFIESESLEITVEGTPKAILVIGAPAERHRQVNVIAQMVDSIKPKPKVKPIVEPVDDD